MTEKSKVMECVDALPEIYQTIYGHPEYNNDSSRKCAERESDILKVIKLYQNYLGKKKLRVLDIGCAQGYYSFTLQNAGCLVDGVDYNENNIACCEALKEENGLLCDFTHAKIDAEYIDSIEDGSYDVILILSVIHHVCYEHGFRYARTLMEKLAKKATLVITELALKEEPLYWNEKLPDSYTEWFANVRFFDELSFETTHLSEIIRPLLIYSDRLACYDDTFYEIKEYAMRSFDIKKNNPDRRYYLNDHTLIKLYRGSDENVKKEMENEILFLQKYGDKLTFVPKALFWRKNDISTVAIYRITKGVNLWDCIQRNEALNWKNIFSALLDNLVELEAEGLYHGDLRVWNVCVKDDKAFLIDYGNLQNTTRDAVAEHFMNGCNISVYDAFVSLMYDCLTNETYDILKKCEVYEIKLCYDLEKIPAPYCTFFKEYLLLEQEKTTYAKVKNIFDRIVLNGEDREFTDREETNIYKILLKRSIERSATPADVMASYVDVMRFAEKNNIELYAKIGQAQQEVFSVMNDKNQDLQSQITNLLDQNNNLQNKVMILQEKNGELDNKYEAIQQRVSWLENTFEQRVKRKIKKIVRRG